MHRRVALVILPLLACAMPVGAQPSLCNDGEVPDLDACRQAGLEAALAYFAKQDLGVMHLEVAAAGRVDPLTWPSSETPVWGVAIPALEGAINEPEIRPYYAAASLGLDMHGYPDAKRGTIDLVASAEALHDEVMESSYPALLAWHLWNLDAFGAAADPAMVDAAADRLLAMQRPDGGWACTTAAFTSPDCAAWAVIGLTGHGRLEGWARQRAISHLEDGYDGTSGGYSDQGSSGVNTISSALVMAAYRALGEPGAIRAETWAHFMDQQQEDGGFRLTASGGSSAWTTRTAVMALAGTDWSAGANATRSDVDSVRTHLSVLVSLGSVGVALAARVRRP